METENYFGHWLYRNLLVKFSTYILLSFRFVSPFFWNFILNLVVEKLQPHVEFKSSKKNGGQLLVINGIRFFRNRQRNGKQYWKCSYYYKQKCPTIAIVHEENYDIKIHHEHCHPVHVATDTK